MSKERLEEIKKSFNFWMEEDESIGLIPEDIEWLIKQAERLQELRKRYLTLTQENEQVNDELIDEFRKNKRYRKAIAKTIDDLENECLWDALVRLKALEESE